MDRQMGRWIDKWMDGWTDGWAQLPKKETLFKLSSNAVLLLSDLWLNHGQMQSRKLQTMAAPPVCVSALSIADYKDAQYSCGMGWLTD